MFRAAIAEETELGIIAKQIVEQGGLVPDDVTIGIVKERLSEEDCKSGFLLDGFPRNVEQARSLDEIMFSMNRVIDYVINIDVNMEQLKARLVGRRMCKACGTSYHVDFNPPKQVGVCGKCGGELYQREDDNKNKVETRLSFYTEQTKPLIDYYDALGNLITIDGSDDIDVVFSNIQAALRSNSL
jgi:adenylate kinase